MEKPKQSSLAAGPQGSDPEGGGFPPEDQGKRRRELLALALVLALACAVRALFLAQWSATPLFASASGDELNFHHTALRLLDPDSSPDSFLYQPLYSFFLAAVYRVLGPEPAAVRILQSLLGLVTVSLFYGLGREIGGRWTALVSALSAALYGPLIAFEGQLLAPALVVPLLASSLWCLLRSCRRRRPAWLLLAGCLLGLLLMGRPEAVVLVFVSGLWWLKESRGLRMRALGPALLVLGLLIGLAPAALHNLRHGAGPVPVSSSGGHSFYLGNNPQATGRFFVPSGQRIDTSSHEAYRRSWQLLAEEAAGRPLEPAEVSAYWWGRGLDFIKAQPAAALRLYGRKLLLGLNHEEMPIQHSYRALAEELPVLGWCVGFGVVFPCALVGTVFGWRRRPAVALLTVLFSSSLAVMALFYVSDRYRMVLVPMAIVLAALGLEELWRAGRCARREAWGAATVLVVGAALCHLPLVSGESQRLARSGLLNIMGSTAADQGDLARARRDFERALALGGAAGRSRAAANLGALAELEGRAAEARRRYVEAIAADPENRFALTQLAGLAERLGELEQAAACWQRLAALAADPAPAEAQVERLRRRMNRAEDS